MPKRKSNTDRLSTLIKQIFYPPTLTQKISHLIIFSLLILAAFLLFHKLGTAPLDNWDESWYADSARYMLATKQFIILHWNHQIWFDKPPMYMWLGVISASIVGVSELSIRLPSAVSGLIIIAIVCIYTYRRFGIIPALVAFSVVSLNNIFIWRARSGNIDIFVTLLIFLTYFVMLSKFKYKYPLLGVVFGCIYLTKASLVFFPLLVFVLFEAVYNYKHVAKLFLQYLLTAGIFLLICAAWLVPGYFIQGYDFVRYYVFQSDQGVGSASIHHFNKNYLLFVYYSLQRRFFFVLMIGLVAAIIKIKEKENFLLLLFGVLLLTELSFTMRNNNWYLIPSIPFWAILCGLATQRVLHIVRDKRYLVLSSAVILLLSGYVSFKTLKENIFPILNTSSTASQTESAKLIYRMSRPTDIVVRLDSLFPNTVYYTDRRVLASPNNNTNNEGYWVTRKELIEKVQHKEVKWLVGPTSEVDAFEPEIKTHIKRIQVNPEEAILRVL